MAKKRETKKATTKKPTGLSITRKGQWYTLSWKIGDDNYSDGQQLGHHKSWQKKGEWTSVSIGKTTTSKSIQVLNDNYYPNTSTKLKRITFRVRGNRQEYTKETSKKITTHKFSWSDWATKAIDLDVPNNPSISAEPDNELTNVCAFPWSVTATDDSKRPYTNMQWETVLVKESNVTDGSKLTWKSNQLGWATGTSAAKSGTITRTEDTALLASGAYTRWVRVRARGIAGASDWKYAKHNYSVPYKPRITSVSAEDNRVGGFSCKVTWTADASTSHPIDKTMVQYTITEPEEGLTCPSGASWTDANISRDTGGKDSAFFSIDDTLSKDQCLFVRVNVQHNSQITYGTPTLAKVGYLKDPTGLSVETDNTTHRATITATNASNVEDSFLAVVYQTASNPSGAFVVGIIPHGSSSVIVQCPDWSGESAVAFGVYAVVGSYQRQQRQDGVSNYKVNARMRSEGTIWDGGAVPSAPANVAVVQTAIKGTVQITWDWTWAGANGAEISWADHEDAWESTDEPDKFLISKLHAAKWNISGLEVGKTWYMRVRLVSETADATTNGPWSDIVSIDLSSAPTVPTLYLSRGVIPQDGSVTASWAYSTTDGTMQAYAEICEATITGEGITYGDIIAHTETAQQTVINAKDAGWQSGETHNLCVRVTSASGHVSDSWSDPVSITVAEPLECEITNTSLVQEHIETNPQEFEPADIVSFETDVEEDVTKLQVSMNPKQSGSGTPSPDNVRPISGWSSVEVYKSGVNLWDEEMEEGFFSTSNGEKIFNNAVLRSANMTLCKPNTDIYVKISDACSFMWYGANKEYLGYRGTVNANTVITIPDNVHYFNFGITKEYYGHDAYNHDISINYPSTDHDYHAYNGQTITKNLGRTVYGGTLDVVSGVLTVDRGYIASYNGETLPSTWISDRDEYASGTTPTIGAEVVYELATPQTYQLTPTEVNTLVGENNIWSNAGQVELRIAESTRDVLSLKQMPLSVTATGAGVGGVTTLAVERAEDYRIDRPDESHADGYEGETVFLYSQTGEDQINANADSLIGALDDGAKYRIVATVQDGLGQSAEDSIDFEVHWTHQAVIPEANVVIDDENLVAKITPVEPTGALAGDTCDIYRLSADRPELIVQDAVFGQTYVDPYPAIGEFGGHRVVFKTMNGDYITEDNQMAWIDFGEEDDDILDLDYHVIDFDGTRIVLNYNVDLSSQWDKDFTETKYLGGSVQGDWNPAVSRSGSISATAITITDQDMIRDMRRLASYSGLCHVRTKDGSSYAADIQVSEDRSHEDYDKIATFSMTVTRVDPERLEGLPLEVWQGEQ